VEAIAQAQAEENRQVQMDLSSAQVPAAVIGRALTSGGNKQHSIERIVAHFQKDMTYVDAARFLKEEYGEGGKGVKIAGQEYALWFSGDGLRIAPGRTANTPDATLVPWEKAAVLISNLLRDGMYAAQDRIDGARENEIRELSEKLWYLRQNFSDTAREQGYLPTVDQIYSGRHGFSEAVLQIGEHLKNPERRMEIATELWQLAVAHQEDSTLLRFRSAPNPDELRRQIMNLDLPPAMFQAKEGFSPVVGSFITEDEINALITRGGNISEGKLRIFSYFVQGHDAKECIDCLKQEYGVGHGN